MTRYPRNFGQGLSARLATRFTYVVASRIRRLCAASRHLHATIIGPYPGCFGCWSNTCVRIRPEQSSSFFVLLTSCCPWVPHANGQRFGSAEAGGDTVSFSPSIHRRQSYHFVLGQCASTAARSISRPRTV